MSINDKKFYVGPHISHKERQSKLDELKARFTNVYVKNLDPDMTQEEFENLFGQYGNITSAVISFDTEGRRKWFGFVNYEKHEGAEAAVDVLHDVEHNGRTLFVAHAQKKAERKQELRRSYEQTKTEKMGKCEGANLYIKNLEDDIDDDKLRSEFEVLELSPVPRSRATITVPQRAFCLCASRLPRRESMLLLIRTTK